MGRFWPGFCFLLKTSGCKKYVGKDAFLLLLVISSNLAQTTTDSKYFLCSDSCCNLWEKYTFMAEFQVENALEAAPHWWATSSSTTEKSELFTLLGVWIFQGYFQNSGHLPSWCPYWTSSEINISGFQDSVHKHKLHFTFCNNAEKNPTIFWETTQRNAESMIPEEKT